LPRYAISRPDLGLPPTAAATAGRRASRPCGCCPHPARFPDLP